MHQYRRVGEDRKWKVKTTTKININPTPPSEKQYVPIIMF